MTEAGGPSQVILADGRHAVTRPVRPEDRPAVAAMFDACSEENLYTRFFTVGHGAVVGHLNHVFAADSKATTYVLVLAGRIVGIADVEPCGPATGEIAFLVADDAHGLGIATLLLERAAEDARASGLDWFVADVLTVNHPMLEVFADAGFTVERHVDHGDVELRMSTALSSEVAAAMELRHALALAHSHSS